MNGCHTMLMAVLLYLLHAACLLGVHSSKVWSRSTQWLNKPRSCVGLCDKGKHVADCTPGQKVVCQPCAPGTFSPRRGPMTECAPCTIHCRRLGEEMAQKCNSDSDMMCQCKPGTWLKHLSNNFCTHLSTCIPGYEVDYKGSPRRDLTCRPCKNGYYSNVTSSTEKCLPHTDCARMGRRVQQKGTNTSDAICSEKKCRCKRDTETNEKECCDIKCQILKKLTKACKENEEYDKQTFKTICNRVRRVKTRHCNCYSNPGKREKCRDKKAKRRERRNLRKLERKLKKLESKLKRKHSQRLSQRNRNKRQRIHIRKSKKNNIFPGQNKSNN